MELNKNIVAESSQTAKPGQSSAIIGLESDVIDSVHRQSGQFTPNSSSVQTPLQSCLSSRRSSALSSDFQSSRRTSTESTDDGAAALVAAAACRAQWRSSRRVSFADVLEVPPGLRSRRASDDAGSRAGSRRVSFDNIGEEKDEDEIFVKNTGGMLSYSIDARFADRTQAGEECKSRKRSVKVSFGDTTSSVGDQEEYGRQRKVGHAGFDPGLAESETRGNDVALGEDRPNGVAGGGLLNVDELAVDEWPRRGRTKARDLYGPPPKPYKRAIHPLKKARGDLQRDRKLSLKRTSTWKVWLRPDMSCSIVKM